MLRVPQRSQGRNGRRRRWGRPLSLRRTSLKRGEQDAQLPLVAITAQASPPDAAIKLKLNRFLRHQLVNQAPVLLLQGHHKIHQISPLRLGQLKSPALSSNKNAVMTTGGIPRHTPTGSLLLNHTQQSTRQQVGLVLLVTQFHNGALNRLHTGLLQ